MSALTMTATSERCFCGALVQEDLEFRAYAEREGRPVRRLRCWAGHTHYLNANPPPPDQPLKGGLGPRALNVRMCTACERVFPIKKNGSRKARLCDTCRAIKPCTLCHGRGKHYSFCKRAAP